MGAGLVECDVTFTRDAALVCRHSQCDLHRTTNILQTQLAATCRTPFTPADGDTAATAQCCTSEITLDEFKEWDFGFVFIAEDEGQQRAFDTAQKILFALG